MGGAAFSGVASRAEVGIGSRRRGATEGFRLSSVPEQKKIILVVLLVSMKYIEYT